MNRVFEHTNQLIGIVCILFKHIQVLLNLSLTILHWAEISGVSIEYDFQMDSMNLHWGRPAQPDKTYIAQHRMHHEFGISNASRDEKTYSR